jgi:hypothetical protein
MQAQKGHEGESVGYLEFQLGIAQFLKRLQNENLEHENHVKRLAPCITLPLLLTDGFERRAERFPVNNGIELLQHGRILLDSVVPLLNIEQSVLVHGHFPGC